MVKIWLKNGKKTTPAERRLNKLEKGYKITSVSRRDLVSLDLATEAEALKLSENEMLELSENMADDYCDQLFSDSLRVIYRELHERKEFQAIA